MGYVKMHGFHGTNSGFENGGKPTKVLTARILVLHSGDNQVLDYEELRFFYERKRRYAIIQGVI